MKWQNVQIKSKHPANTRRYKHVIMVSKRRFDAIIRVYYVLCLQGSTGISNSEGITWCTIAWLMKEQVMYIAPKLDITDVLLFFSFYYLYKDWNRE